MGDKELKVEMIVTQTTSNKKPYRFISVSVVDEASGVEFLSLRIPTNKWGDVVTSHSFVHGLEATLRGTDVVGKNYEHKSVGVRIPHTSFSRKDMERAAKKAIKEHEVDGWRGRVSDAVNAHKVTERHDDDSRTYSVHFGRHVDP